MRVSCLLGRQQNTILVQSVYFPWSLNNAEQIWMLRETDWLSDEDQYNCNGLITNVVRPKPPVKRRNINALSFMCLHFAHNHRRKSWPYARILSRLSECLYITVFYIIWDRIYERPYSYWSFVNPSSAGIVFRRQNLTSISQIKDPVKSFQFSNVNKVCVTWLQWTVL